MRNKWSQEETNEERSQKAQAESYLKAGAQVTRNPVKGKRWLYANQEATIDTKERRHFPNRRAGQIPFGYFQWCKKPSWVS
jgi:hypothetical protein